MIALTVSNVVIISFISLVVWWCALLLITFIHWSINWTLDKEPPTRHILLSLIMDWLGYDKHPHYDSGYLKRSSGKHDADATDAFLASSFVVFVAPYLIVISTKMGVVLIGLLCWFTIMALARVLIRKVKSNISKNTQI